LAQPSTDSYLQTVVALNIKDPATEKSVRELANPTGESVRVAFRRAAQERLQRVRRERGRPCCPILMHARPTKFLASTSTGHRIVDAGGSIWSSPPRPEHIRFIELQCGD